MANKKAYPGTISSVILSVIVVMLLLLPFYTANHLQKVRDGEGKYEFKEVMFFDISSVDDFRVMSNGKPLSFGEGGFQWTYITYNGFPRVIVHQEVNILTTPIDGVIDGYAVQQLNLIGGYPFKITYQLHSAILFYFDFEKEFLLENDITRVDIFLDFNLEIDGIRCYIFRTIEEFNYYHTFGELVSFDISVEHLLLINTMPEEGVLTFYGAFPNGYDPHDGILTFDMQFYHIEEFKITTIDYMGIAMIGGGIFMIFCSVLMLPHVTFSGVIGRLVGKRGD